MRACVRARVVQAVTVNISASVPLLDPLLITTLSSMIYSPPGFSVSDSASAEEHGCINIIEPCLLDSPFICSSGTSDWCEGKFTTYAGVPLSSFF